MYHLICVCFKGFVPLILALACAAEYTLAVFPTVLNFLVTNVALGIVEWSNGINAVGVFGTIHTTTRKQACQLCNGNAVYLLMKNMMLRKIKT